MSSSPVGGAFAASCATGATGPSPTWARTTSSRQHATSTFWRRLMAHPKNICECGDSRHAHRRRKDKKAEAYIETCSRCPCQVFAVATNLIDAVGRARSRKQEERTERQQVRAAHRLRREVFQSVRRDLRQLGSDGRFRGDTQSLVNGTQHTKTIATSMAEAPSASDRERVGGKPGTVYVKTPDGRWVPATT